MSLIWIIAISVVIAVVTAIATAIVKRRFALPPIILLAQELAGPSLTAVTATTGACVNHARRIVVPTHRLDATEVIIVLRILVLPCVVLEGAAMTGRSYSNRAKRACCRQQ